MRRPNTTEQALIISRMHHEHREIANTARRAEEPTAGGRVRRVRNILLGHSQRRANRKNNGEQCLRARNGPA